MGTGNDYRRFYWYLHSNCRESTATSDLLIFDKMFPQRLYSYSILYLVKDNIIK